jgi:hypothetical protein
MVKEGAMSSPSTPESLTALAEQARATANLMREPEARAALLEMAARYEELAIRAAPLVNQQSESISK